VSAQSNADVSASHTGRGWRHPVHDDQQMGKPSGNLGDGLSCLPCHGYPRFTQTVQTPRRSLPYLCGLKEQNQEEDGSFAGSACVSTGGSAAAAQPPSGRVRTTWKTGLQANCRPADAPIGRALPPHSPIANPLPAGRAAISNELTMLGARQNSKPRSHPAVVSSTLHPPPRRRLRPRLPPRHRRRRLRPLPRHRRRRLRLLGRPAVRS
jgi:hypothetical protein